MAAAVPPAVWPSGLDSARPGARLHSRVSLLSLARHGSLLPEGKAEPSLSLLPLSRHLVKFLAQSSRCLRNVCSINK